MKTKRAATATSSLLIDYLFITFGTFIVALAVNWLFVPNRIVTGGVTGVAILLNYLFHFPISITSLILNIPLFCVGYRFLGGREFAVKTLFGILVVTLFLQATDTLKHEALTTNTLLASIYGGFLLGAGLGIVFRGRGTTGGSDLAARVSQHLTGYSAGKMLLVIDGSIIAEPV